MKTKFVSLYPENTARHEKRYSFIRSEFASLFGKEPTRFFSAPGRTEVCGNHTDHNHGKVAAAAVNLDIIAAVVPTDDGIDRKSTRLNSSHYQQSRMPSSA